MRTVNTIIKQHQAGLISKSEMWLALEVARKNAKFARDYSDTLSGYDRFDAIVTDCNFAMSRIS